MKKIFASAFAFFLLMSASVHAKVITVHVEGIVCAFCVQGIKKQFKKTDVVDKVEVHLDEKIVKIEIKNKQDLDDNRIKTLIKDAGYNVRLIER